MWSEDAIVGQRPLPTPHSDSDDNTQPIRHRGTQTMPRHGGRSVHFGNASIPHRTPTPSSPPRALQQSTLIPYEDPRTARHSLPEFYGTRYRPRARYDLLTTPNRY
ncbi:Hypothetical protein CINCED_3A009466 [Cinara cedri]|uniref:Uncharacterized protein n=1 Tax=Cinara cedri TaxID=506608 RepID=A0A5E4MQM4_9HEMI|nr:Hypothetical protein CINCED_3A009466 [Cinara cedri]